jgi:hypothetical protein
MQCTPHIQYIYDTFQYCPSADAFAPFRVNLPTEMYEILMRAVCVAHLNRTELVTLLILCKVKKLRSVSLCKYKQGQKLALRVHEARSPSQTAVAVHVASAWHVLTHKRAAAATLM